MMRTGLAYLLTVALGLHAALGCCWHTGTSCELCENAAADPAVAANCCDHHHEHPSHSSGPCKCRLECQGVCNVVCPKKTELAKATLAAPFEAVAALSTEAQCFSLPVRRAASLEPDGFLPPLRAHLLLRVLLI
jgi:hypothetical protein